MKESKFLELLNLYIDHEISPADAALLEADIEQNPAHRRIYGQYCQMQCACSLMAEDFRSKAEQTAPAAGEVAGRVVKLQPSGKRPAWQYYVAGLAAAACVGLVFVEASRDPGAAPQTVATALSSPAKTEPRQSTAAPANPGRVQLAAMPFSTSRTHRFVNQRLAQLSPLDSLGYDAGATTARWTAPAGTTLQAQLAEQSTILQFVFDQPAAPARPNTFRIHRRADDKLEMVTWTFRR